MVRKFILLLFLISNTILFSQDLDSLYSEFNNQKESADSKSAEATLQLIAEAESQVYFSIMDEAHSYFMVEDYHNYLETLLKGINYLGEHYYPSTAEFHSKKDSIYYSSIENLNIILERSVDIVALNISAIFKMELEEYEWAIEDYELIVKYDSLNYTTYYNKASAYSKIGNNEQALKDYSTCLKLNPNYTSAYLNRGFLYMDLENYKKAIIDYKKVIDLGEVGYEIAFAYNNLGFCKYKLGKFDQAIKSIEESIEIYPINSYAYHNLALIYIRLDDKEMACKSINKSIELGFVNSYGNEILELLKDNCQ